MVPWRSKTSCQSSRGTPSASTSFLMRAWLPSGRNALLIEISSRQPFGRRLTMSGLLTTFDSSPSDAPAQFFVTDVLDGAASSLGLSQLQFRQLFRVQLLVFDRHRLQAAAWPLAPWLRHDTGAVPAVARSNAGR